MVHIRILLDSSLQNGTSGSMKKVQDRKNVQNVKTKISLKIWLVRLAFLQHAPFIVITISFLCVDGIDFDSTGRIL